MKTKKFIQEYLRKFLNENTNIEDFKQSLLDITTLNLEDDQVQIPPFNQETDPFIFQIGKIYIHIRQKDDLPNSGPFELFILNVNDEVIGFIRGTKNPTTISFNLIYITPENRGWGIGPNIYEYFLNSGYIIKSDTEITEATYNLYLKLLNKGYTPLLFDDGTVGLKK